MRKHTLLLSALLLAACAPAGAEDISAQKNNTETKEDESKGYRKIGDLKPTFYWVAMEKPSSKPKNRALKNLQGDVIRWVDEAFFKEIRMEGTGMTTDGVCINYDARVTLPDGTKEIRWVICGREAPYGYGLDRRVLVPFRSLAVDPTVVPMDSKIYIPKAKGIKLPDGSVHDGYFSAIDIGAAIQNKRIDIFTAYGDQSAVFKNAGVTNMTALEVFIVE